MNIVEETFGFDPRFSLFVHLVGNWGGTTVKTMNQDILSNDSYRDLVNSIVKLDPQISFKAHLRDLDSFHSKCYASLRNSYVIGSDGIVYKCTERFDMPENQIGKLTEDGDLIIDHSKHAKWLECVEPPDHPSCTKCKYWGSCLDGPCPKAKIEAYMDSKKSFCPRTREAVPEIMLLIEQDCYKNF